MDSERPATAVCGDCGRTLTPNPKGRPAKFCKPSCRVMAHEKAHRRPKAPKVPMEDRIASRIWQAMADAGFVTGELPPKREDAA